MMVRSAKHFDWSWF